MMEPPPQRNLLFALPTTIAHLTVFILLYLALSPFCSSSKQKSYLLSTVSSGTMTVLSLFALKEFAQGMGLLGFAGLEPIEGMAIGGSREEVVGGALMGMRRVMGLQEVGKGALTFFRSYLIADLLVGSVFYRSNIGLLTGWVHHLVYIFLTTYIQYLSLSPIFLLTCILELPTFHLGLSSLRPSIFRHDLTFLLLFGLTRILFHGYVMWMFTVPTFTSPWMAVIGLGGIALGGVREGLDGVNGSWVPAGMMAAAMPLHVIWFNAGVEGYIRRWKAGSLGTAKNRTEVNGSMEQEPATINVQAASSFAPMEPSISSTGDAPSWLLPDVQAQAPALHRDDSEPATPPEEGVVTPYTPYGIPGNNALTSYFLPRKRGSAGDRPVERVALLEFLPGLPAFIPDNLHFELPERLQGIHLPSAADLKEKREELKNQVAGALNAWRDWRDLEDGDAVK